MRKGSHIETISHPLQDRILAMRREKKSYREIGNALGMSGAYARQVALGTRMVSTASITLRKEAYTNLEAINARQLWHAGRSITSIAARAGCRVADVKHWLNGDPVDARSLTTHVGHQHIPILSRQQVRHRLTSLAPEINNHLIRLMAFVMTFDEQMTSQMILSDRIKTIFEIRLRRAEEWSRISQEVYVHYLWDEPFYNEDQVAGLIERIERSDLLRNDLTIDQVADWLEIWHIQMGGLIERDDPDYQKWVDKSFIIDNMAETNLQVADGSLCDHVQ